MSACGYSRRDAYQRAGSRARLRARSAIKRAPVVPPWATLLHARAAHARRARARLDNCGELVGRHQLQHRPVEPVEMVCHPNRGRLGRRRSAVHPQRNAHGEGEEVPQRQHEAHPAREREDWSANNGRSQSQRERNAAPKRARGAQSSAVRRPRGRGVAATRVVRTEREERDWDKDEKRVDDARQLRARQQPRQRARHRATRQRSGAARRGLREGRTCPQQAGARLAVLGRSRWM